jgi:Helix-turn-helix domain
VAKETQDKDRPALLLQDRGAFKIREAAIYLGGVSQITVRRLIARGLIKRHPALRHIVIAKVELDRFLAGSSTRNVHGNPNG